MSNKTKTDGSARVAGRPPLPKSQRKQNYTVCLREADRDAIALKYGSLQGAVNWLLTSNKPDTQLRDALLLIRDASMGALAVSGEGKRADRK